MKWLRGLRRGSVADRLLGLRVRIPLGSWMSVGCVYSVMSGRGLWDGLITLPEECMSASVIRYNNNLCTAIKRWIEVRLRKQKEQRKEMKFIVLIKDRIIQA